MPENTIGNTRIAQSPCINCVHQNDDKGLCAPKCLLLSAYNDLPGGVCNSALVNKKKKRKRDVSTCIAQDCTRDDMYAFGLCKMHYQRWRAGKFAHPVKGVWGKTR